MTLEFPVPFFFFFSFPSLLSPFFPSSHFFLSCPFLLRCVQRLQKYKSCAEMQRVVSNLLLRIFRDTGTAIRGEREEERGLMRGGQERDPWMLLLCDRCSSPGVCCSCCLCDRIGYCYVVEMLFMWIYLDEEVHLYRYIPHRFRHPSALLPTVAGAREGCLVWWGRWYPWSGVSAYVHTYVPARFLVHFYS